MNLRKFLNVFLFVNQLLTRKIINNTYLHQTEGFMFLIKRRNKASPPLEVINHQICLKIIIAEKRFWQLFFLGTKVIKKFFFLSCPALILPPPSLLINWAPPYFILKFTFFPGIK